MIDALNAKLKELEHMMKSKELNLTLKEKEIKHYQDVAGDMVR